MLHPESKDITKKEKEILKDKFNNDKLTFIEGDGLEYEIYQDEENGKFYKVSIEISRFFDDAEEVTG
tara:strand:+ start:254 stop:454 length:201 start_codon:yes stop_codon:yes gene_type:complete